MILGAVIGDTVGSVYENNNIKTTDFPLFSKGSNYTDDTVLTIAVGEWLLTDHEHALGTLEESLVKWAKKYPKPAGGSYGTLFFDWVTNPDREPYQSWGNGSAMRCSAVGWAFDTLEETLEIAATSAEVTHNHPEGIKGAQAVAAAIWMARNGHSKQDIKNFITTKFNYDLDFTIEQIRPTYSFNESCKATVPQSIVAFLDSTDFENAIRLAVSLGGDSDTITSITGAIAEAFYKTVTAEMVTKMLEILPKEFINILAQFNKG